MILADTSIWIDHLRTGDSALVFLLEEGRVMMHPFVLGELACGRLSAREQILGHLRRLPEAPVATDEEVVHFIGKQHLGGSGIGFIDAHLLAAVILHGHGRIWTRDTTLREAAERLGIAHPGA